MEGEKKRKLDSHKEKERERNERIRERFGRENTLE